MGCCEVNSIITYLLLEALVYPGLLAIVILVLITQWYLRKLAGRIQYRRGPTYTGPAGILQPLADFIKLLSKEDLVNKYGLKYSPLIIIVIAIGAVISILSTTPLAPYPIYSSYDFVVIVYLLTLSPLALAYLSLSNPNPYTSIGVGRYLALLVTSEPLFILSLLTPIIIASRDYGAVYSLYKSSLVSYMLWTRSLASVIAMFTAAISGFIALLAVLMVKPFDFPEAESEIYWGLFTELGGPRLALGFFLKFTEKIVFPMIYVLLFLGGTWPFTNSWILGVLIVFAKYFIVLTIIGILENTLPRYRPDQGIVFLWKYGYSLAILSLFLSLLS